MNNLVGHDPSHTICTDTSKNNPLYKAFDALLEGVQIIDFNWCCIYANQALTSGINISSEKLLGHRLTDVFPGIEQTAMFNTLKQCMDDRLPMQFEEELQYSDRPKKWYKLKVEPIQEGLLILSLDITSYKEATDKASKTSRLYAFMSQVNQHIVRVKDEASLFRNSCLMALEFGKFKVAWIGIFNSAASTINLVEQCGIEDEDAKRFLNIPYDDKGPQAYVVRTGSHYICNDIEHDFELENWKPFAAKHRVRSCIVLPIRKQGIVIGSFNLYSTELNFSHKEETPLLVEIAKDMSFALDMLEKTKKQQETEALIINREKHFRALIENSADMISLSNADGKLLYASPSVLKQFGYSIEDVSHIIAFYFIHPMTRLHFWQKESSCCRTPANQYITTIGCGIKMALGYG